MNELTLSIGGVYFKFPDQSADSVLNNPRIDPALLPIGATALNQVAMLEEELYTPQTASFFASMIEGFEKYAEAKGKFDPEVFGRRCTVCAMEPAAIFGPALDAALQISYTSHDVGLLKAAVGLASLVGGKFHYVSLGAPQRNPDVFGYLES